jgi:ABC-2 type transport system permease protein
VTAPAVLLIAGAELRMFTRSVPAVVLAGVLPTALGALLVWAESDTGKAGDGATAALLVVTLMALTAYTAGTTALAARRQQFVLKRLRLSGTGDAAILAGVLAPAIVLTLLQAALLFAIVAAAGAPAPARPLLPVLALVIGTALAGALAVGTAAFTASPEYAQFTTVPFALAIVGGGYRVVVRPAGDAAGALLALPGVPVAQLARSGWEAVPTLPALAALCVKLAAAAPLALRVFTWQPRR